MIGSVTLLVVAGLLVVVFLDRPYQQDGAYVAPSEMQTTIRLMEREFADDPTFQPPATIRVDRLPPDWVTGSSLSSTRESPVPRPS